MKLIEKKISEVELAEMLRDMGFERICIQEPSDEELESEDASNYPIEWADHVWKRKSDREFVVVSISRCILAAYKSLLINIDVSDVVASELAEQSA